MSMYIESPPDRGYDLYLDGELFTNLDADSYMAIMSIKERFDDIYADAAKCGRGWVGMQGNCKRAKAVQGMNKAQRQEFANSIRKARGMGTREEDNAASKHWEQVEKEFKGGTTVSRGGKKKASKSAESAPKKGLSRGKKAARTRAKNKAAQLTPLDRKIMADEKRLSKGLERREAVNERRAAAAEAEQKRANRSEGGKKGAQTKKRKAAAAKGAQTRARGRAETEFLTNNPAAMKSAERQLAKRAKRSGKDERELMAKTALGKRTAKAGLEVQKRITAAAKQRKQRKSDSYGYYFDSYNTIPTRRYA